MGSNREKARQQLVYLGFSAREIEVAEQLAAKHDLSVGKLLRISLALYQARDSGHLVCRYTSETSNKE